MDEATLTSYFPNALSTPTTGPILLEELSAICRIHSLSAEDLSFKWESYCMKMGADTQLSLKTLRDFKKDLQDTLERESRGKVLAAKDANKKSVGATPRGQGKGDVYDMLDGIVPNAPHTAGGSTKRKNNFTTPGAKSSRSAIAGSPSDQKPRVENGTSTSFADRKGAGTIQESLNHSNMPFPDPPESIPPEPRFKIKSNTDISKFSYKTMSMKLSEASALLDDRIEEFVTLIQDHHKLDDSAIGNPAAISQNEIVAVGRIACDTPDGKINAQSLVLETSRRLGNGFRVPLKVDKLQDYALFQGKIVALRGTNASGAYFAATELLPLPPQPITTSTIDAIDVHNDRMTDATGEAHPLVTVIAAGPYTTDTDLDFSPFIALLNAVESQRADCLVLIGPFIDVEHPLIAAGDFDLPANYPVDPDKATLLDLFRARFAAPLRKLADLLPSLTILLCPSVRDAIARHAAWPQDRFVRRELALPRAAVPIANPMLIALNELLFGISSQDALDQVRGAEVARGKPAAANLLERAARHLVDQRHFMPVFPPVERRRAAPAPAPAAAAVTAAPAGSDAMDVDPAPGADTAADIDTVFFGPAATSTSLDTSYLSLCGFVGARPDVLILPSVLPAFARVVEGVLAINPGSVSKRRGAGTYARVAVGPLVVEEEERERGEEVPGRVYERCRVDVVKI